MGLVWAARRSFGAATARWRAGGTRASPGPGQGKFLERRAHPPAVLPPAPCSPARSPGAQRSGAARTLVSSRAQPGFEKSRSLTKRSRAQRFLGAGGRMRFPATAAFPAAAVSADPAVAGRRRLSAAPTPTTVPSSAARGRRRLAAAARARPSSATGAREAERTSLLGLLSPPPSRLHRRCHSFTRSKALQKFAPGPGPLVPCPPGQESSWPLQPLSGLPRTDCRLAPRCQQLPGSGALLLGAAGEGALRTLPKTPAPEPQALALGSW